MEKNIGKRIRTLLVTLLALVFVVTSIGSVRAAEMKIKPKGNKKIKIAVMDLISAIEVAALANSYYKKNAQARKWELDIFDLKVNNGQAGPTMENIIAAGYDGVIVNWTNYKYYEPQCKKAFDKGIPVVGVACGALVPGVIANVTSGETAFGAVSGEYLCNRLKPGDKIIAYYDPNVNTGVYRFAAANTAFKLFNITVAQEIFFSGSGDPHEQAYEKIRNALLGDTKKEIKGIWSHWEGEGVSGARAAHDTNRDDVISVTCDDSPGTYTALRTMPSLWGTAATLGYTPLWTAMVFEYLDQVFAGKAVREGQTNGPTPYLVTKDNLPPKGYFFSFCGYKGRPQDFQVK